MNRFKQLWHKFAKSKKYREEFVAAQVKRGIPLQIRSLLKQQEISQDILAERAGLSQGVVSRAANPNYGNLTLNTIIRIAAGFDVAFVGKFVPFSELGRWFTELSEESLNVPKFEDDGIVVPSGLEGTFANVLQFPGPIYPEQELSAVSLGGYETHTTSKIPPQSESRGPNTAIVNNT